MIWWFLFWSLVQTMTIHSFFLYLHFKLWLLFVLLLFYGLDRIFFFLLLHGKQHIHASIQRNVEKRREIAIAKKGNFKRHCYDSSWQYYMSSICAHGRYLSWKTEGREVIIKRVTLLSTSLTNMILWWWWLWLILNLLFFLSFLQNDTQWQPTW